MLHPTPVRKNLTGFIRFARIPLGSSGRGGGLRRCESCDIRKTETDGSSGTKAFRMRSG